MILLLLLYFFNNLLELGVVYFFHFLDAEGWLVVSSRACRVFLRSGLLGLVVLLYCGLRFVIEEAIRHRFRGLVSKLVLKGDLLCSTALLLLKLLFTFLRTEAMRFVPELAVLKQR